MQKESGSQIAERRIIRNGGTLFCIIGKSFGQDRTAAEDPEKQDSFLSYRKVLRLSYKIKTLRGNAHDAQRKAAKAAAHRRTK